MNVGQILETHLGWAAQERRRRLQEMIEKNFGPDRAPQEAEAGLRGRRQPGQHAAQELLDDVPDKELPKLVQKLKNGVHVATPVFDGAREDEMNDPHRRRAPPRSVDPLRRPHRRAVRPGRHRRRHVHAEAAPPRGREDPRPVHRAVLARHPAAAGRQGPVRRSAARRDGGLGDGGLRRRLLAPGVPHRQVRRRGRPHAHVRGHRQGREHARVGPARVVQRAHQGAPEPRARRGAPRVARGAGGPRGRRRASSAAGRRRAPRRGAEKNTA